MLSHDNVSAPGLIVYCYFYIVIYLLECFIAADWVSGNTPGL